MIIFFVTVWGLLSRIGVNFKECGWL